MTAGEEPERSTPTGGHPQRARGTPATSPRPAATKEPRAGRTRGGRGFSRDVVHELDRDL